MTWLSVYSVLYFSWHRYEHGRFWPFLQESNADTVGQGRGQGFTVNLPWNQVLSPPPTSSQSTPPAPQLWVFEGHLGHSARLSLEFCSQR